MKKIRYGVAMSLDGFIAGPNGGPIGLSRTRKSISRKSGRASTPC